MTSFVFYFPMGCKKQAHFNQKQSSYFVCRYSVEEFFFHSLSSTSRLSQNIASTLLTRMRPR